ncbi:MAG: hypothetical protein HKN33_13680 [Pyrinomonadaceae bacterium]|nr:hypothetical protein [Pyrinomonadaceae bacterium]
MKKMNSNLASCRLLTVTLAVLAVIGLFASPTVAYEEDTHFLMTFVICRSVGFTDQEALTIAAVDQGMDDSVTVNAHENGVPNIEEEWRWHALDLEGKMGAAGIIERRDLLFKEALEETDERNKLIRLGIFFHYQQDTWAHRHHEKSNHLSRDNFTTFNTPTGHGPWGSKPDRPPLDPVAALMSLEDGIVFASRFLERSMKREPAALFAGYVPKGGSINKKWKDKRKGKFFNQIDLSDEKPGSTSLYLKRLIEAQINAYKRSRDANPFYFAKRTPDKVDFEKVRGNLQFVVGSYKESVGEFLVPGQAEKLAQGFTEMTTEQLLFLGKERK